jgi:hypothetical protein
VKWWQEAILWALLVIAYVRLSNWLPERGVALAILILVGIGAWRIWIGRSEKK